MHDLVAAPRGADDDVASALGVLGGVGEQVGDHLGQPRRIGVDHQTGLRHVDDRAAGRAARAAGSPVSIARATTLDTSTRSCFSSILPRVMRETSSRSSTRRTRCLACRSMIAPLLLDLGRALQLHQLQRGQDRRERVAQLVAEHRQELVLGASCLFEAIARRLELRRVLLEALARPSQAEVAWRRAPPVPARRTA